MSEHRRRRKTDKSSSIQGTSLSITNDELLIHTDEIDNSPLSRSFDTSAASSSSLAAHPRREQSNTFLSSSQSGSLLFSRVPPVPVLVQGVLVPVPGHTPVSSKNYYDEISQSIYAPVIDNKSMSESNERIPPHIFQKSTVHNNRVHVSSSSRNFDCGDTATPLNHRQAHYISSQYRSPYQSYENMDYHVSTQYHSQSPSDKNLGSQYIISNNNNRAVSRPRHTDRQLDISMDISPSLSFSMKRQKRILSYVKYYSIGLFLVAISGCVFVIGLSNKNNNDPTVVHQEITYESSFQRRTSVAISDTLQTDLQTPRYQIPIHFEIKDDEKVSHHSNVHHSQHHRPSHYEDEGFIESLRDEFHEWIDHHRRDYKTHEEKERRFHIWKDNHIRTMEKNKQHGPCKMTNQPVFGSNHFKDLSPEEFQAKYLTGYKGPKTDELGDRRQLRSDQRHNAKTIPQVEKHRRRDYDAVSSSGVSNDPRHVTRHKTVQDRYLKLLEETPILSKKYIDQWQHCYSKTYYNKQEQEYCKCYQKTYYDGGKNTKEKYYRPNCYKTPIDANVRTSNSRYSRCDWFDVSCWLQDIFAPYYKSSYESRFSNDYSYPSSIDWRHLGAVTSIHSQGSCGACWAITAVETIEAVNYINTGKLVDLSESEVIACDDTCEMCNGGWPQNAYAYAMKHEGLPSEKSLSYDGDLLMILSAVKSGSSDELTEEQFDSYLSQMCPADNHGSSNRYGAITGYAYATDRCVCYTDGTGCDCDKQNEALAVMNIASYGPATVCLEASTWQDYTGGIITSESGCSSAFLNMNHCVQAVGYAFVDVTDDDDVSDEGKSKSKRGDNKSTSRREGYWIIRNQWSTYWGMNGYAYVAMGENTCGVLNDMTQVFMD